jgi:hypothetical protein
LKNVSDELLVDLLRSWEQWTGEGKTFYTEIGVSGEQCGPLLSRAKKLVRSGKYAESEFKEVKVVPDAPPLSSCGCTIELAWDQGKVIRFSAVDQLVDFLKKAA